RTTACATFLIETQIGVNIVDKDDQTALTLAVSHYNHECIAVLLENLADVDKSSIETWKSAFEKCRKVLKDRQKKRNDSHVTTLLMDFAKHPYCELLQKMLELGEKVDDTDVDGKTALMYACWYNQCECVKTLLKGGANVSACDIDGITPLMYACMRGCDTCCSTLLNAGASIKAEDKNGKTAIFVTKVDRSRFSQTYIIYEYLLTQGASFELCNVDAHLRDMFIECFDYFSSSERVILYDLFLRYECFNCAQDLMFRIKSEPEASFLRRECERTNTLMKSTWLHKYSARAARSIVTCIGDMRRLITPRKLKVYISSMGCLHTMDAAEALFPPDEDTCSDIKEDASDVDDAQPDDASVSSYESDTEFVHNDTDGENDEMSDIVDENIVTGISNSELSEEFNAADDTSHIENMEVNPDTADSDSDNSVVFSWPQYEVVMDASDCSDFDDMEDVEDDWFL
ncbi:unnamed protein product, partial [Owenia fusiformis]